MTQAIIFDLDGTLIDSKKFIDHCFQSITHKLAPERINNTKNILIGPPLSETVSQILDSEHPALIDNFVQLFIKMHDEQIIHHAKPFDGVIEILSELNNKNIPMAIATNKRSEPTKKLITYFGWNKYFKIIKCSDTDNIKINKKEILRQIINKNIQFKNAYFVGDTVNDGLASNEIGLPFIKAEYGYGKDQDWSKIKIKKTIKKIEEIKKIMF